MSSSQIQILNFRKPDILLPPKPLNGRKNSYFPTYKQQVHIAEKEKTLIVRATTIDVKPSELAQTQRLTFNVKVKVRGLFPGFKTSNPYDTFVVTLGLELVSADCDPSTGKEKETIKGIIKGTVNSSDEVTLETNFKVPKEFGVVGAVLVANEHHEEVFLHDIVLQGIPNWHLKISCESWVYPTDIVPTKRIFFTNKCYLPSETPRGLMKLRMKELENLRGNGHEKRKPFERIYDYDKYNDLGDPEKHPNLERPVLGGTEFPYPRRCRTGRAETGKGSLSEIRERPVYVPKDEKFSAKRSDEFEGILKELYGVVYGLAPTLSNGVQDISFSSFTAIDTLFTAGISLCNAKNPPASLDDQDQVKRVKDNQDQILRFPAPEFFNKDKFGWLSDEEFGRQTLAGMNPLSIQLLTEWPLKSELDPKIYGPAESMITKDIIQKQIKCFSTFEEAKMKKRLFILDYHDLLLPYVAKVRELEDTTLYGSRTVLFLADDGTLKPVAIELTCPPIGDKPQWKQVFTPSNQSIDCWLWRLAKAHVLAHDTGFHQLVSHWLRTHASVEPYIIATNRQLSKMHPIYRLLRPHFRYTMEINARARDILINAGGVIEKGFSLGKYCMELSSVAYDKLWRFDTQALPDDLIKRGMAVERPLFDHGLHLTIQDYPYANDGLLLWDGIKQWVDDYVSHYYPEAHKVECDTELQQWWHEVRTKGHEDKKDEKWWPVLNTQHDLIKVLTTIIWVASGHHAAVNFGQYAYAGYFPNRPTIIRTNMPTENNEQEYQNFLNNPEKSLLNTLPKRVQATTVMAILDVLSSHSLDEEYIGHTLEPSWEADPVIKMAYEKFTNKMEMLDAIIDDRNNDPKNKNRTGAGVLPYELFKPLSNSGVTGKGVPNSISI
ncbi:linoleate 13S-lipoxygenase 2-1, chloroplastic-like [Mercurialis annua]|uniref:linoleate 13S-lipoxygenase 2-1, chloroplastic-like n=1 Tax=Mercurialis annua TaxID=3986 RepID=UPI0021606B87|nr:linoleate 13S-lipoxygenase 2-1, chloroplastic-like [Mercurialis annua]